MHGSASFRHSYTSDRVAIPEGRIDRVIYAYPDGNPEAMKGRAIIEARFPTEPSVKEMGEQVRITVRQEEDRKGKMLFSAAGGSLQLAQFSRPGNDNYRKVSGTVSGTIYEAVNEQLIANAACVPCSASFVTQVQF
jgi:hypothetical protein